MLALALLALATLPATAARPVKSPSSYENPVYPFSAPDPMALQAGAGDYYAYHTGSLFPILRSSDLVTWREAGTALQSKPSWVVQTGDSHPWAPSVLHDSEPCPGRRGGSCYYLYYVGLHGSLDPPTHCVAVAVSHRPGGPYSDLGPLTSSDGSLDQSGRPPGCGDDYGYSNIDPAPFVDGDGKPYLYVATNRYCEEPAPGEECTFYPTVSVIPLAADLIHASGARKPLFQGDPDTWEQQGTVPKVEGPWMEKRDSTYYLFYSGGNYRGAYGTGYATASSPLGGNSFPAFAKATQNPILAQTAEVFSPGGGSMIKGPQGGDWLIYHGRADSYPAPRTLRIDPATWSGGAVAVNGPTVGPQSPAP